MQKHNENGYIIILLLVCMSSKLKKENNQGYALVV